MAGTGPLPLHGCRILVTRPAHQAGQLESQIRQQGGETLLFPLLSIEPPHHPDQVCRQLQDLQADVVIFVSRNAVEATRSLLGEHELPQQVMAAVGRATADAMREAGWPVVLQPEQDFSSEGLLALPALASVAGQRIVIIRGEGGRELLADTLRERGAQVDYIETYRRVAAVVDDSQLLDSLRRGMLQAAVITSQESLEVLLGKVNDLLRPALLALPLAVMSARLARLAQDAGFQHTAIAQPASDAGIVLALEELCRLHRVSNGERPDE